MPTSRGFFGFASYYLPIIDHLRGINVFGTD
jgi:hypothetical protein